MSSVDERIVEMRFDNNQFQSGIQDSIKSLAELRESLDLNTKTTKLSNFINIFKGVSSIAKTAVRGFSTMFNSAKNFVGQLTGITSLISQQTSKMRETISALTGGALASGFQEYELKLNSVRTILSNVGDNYSSHAEAIESVSEALEQLNAYADKTIYNFGEMTRNIGYFTVAGVGLNESVAAIKGFSNLAALQGVDSAQAARATYQLSQAMSTGYVKLLDWRSMENAGMAGQKFRDILVDVAKKSGVEYDKLLKKHKSFRETLSEGWLTSDIMLKSLQIFSGDFGDDFVKQMQAYSRASKDAYDISEDLSWAAKALSAAESGDYSRLAKYGTLANIMEKENVDLAKAYEMFRESYKKADDTYDYEAMKKEIALSIAATDITERREETLDYLAKAYHLTAEEAKKYYDIAVEANEAAKEVTTFTKLIDALKEAAQSGWSAAWEVIIGNLDDAKVVWTSVNNEIGGILDKSSKARLKMLKEWKEKTSVYKKDEEGNNVFVSNKLFDAIANFYHGISAIAGHFRSILSEIFEPITADRLVKATETILDISKAFRTFATSEAGLAKLTPIFRGIASALGFVKDTIFSMISGGAKFLWNFITTGRFPNILGKIGTGISSLINKLKGADIINKTINAIGSVLTPVANGLGDAIEWVVDLFIDFFDFLDKIDVINRAVAAFESMEIGMIDAFKAIGNAGKVVFNWIVNNLGLSGVVDWIVNAYTNVSNAVKGFFNVVKNTASKFNGVFGFFDRLWKSIKNIFTVNPLTDQLWESAGLGKVVVWLNGFVGSIKTVFASIKGLYNNVTSWIGKLFTALFSNKSIHVKSYMLDSLGLGGIKTGLLKFVDFIKTIPSALSSAFSSIWNGLVSFWSSLQNVASWVSKLFTTLFSSKTTRVKSYILENLGLSSIKTGLIKFVDFIKGIPSKISPIFTTIWNAIVSFWESLKNFNLKEFISNIDINRIWDFIKSIPTKVWDYGKIAIDAIKGWAVSFWESVKKWFTKGDLMKGVSESKGVFGKIWAFFGNVIETLKGWGIKVYDTFKKVFGSISDWISDIFGGKSSDVSIGGGSGGAPTIRSGMFSGVLDFFKRAAEWLGDKLKGVPAFFKDVWDNAKVSIFPKIGEFFSNGFSSLGTVFSSVGSFFSGVPDAFSKAWDWVKINAFPGIVSALKTIGGWLKAALNEIESLLPTIAAFGMLWIAHDIASAKKATAQATKALVSWKTQLAKASKWKAISGTIMAAVAAIAAILGAIYVLTTFSEDDYKKVSKGLVYVGILAGGLVALITVSAIMTKVAGGATAMNSSSMAMVSAAASLLIVVFSLKTLADAMSTTGGPGRLVGAVAASIVMLGALVAANLMLKKLGPLNKKNLPQALGIMSLAVSLIFVAQAIGQITKLIHTYGYLKTGVATAFIVGIIAVLTAASKLSAIPTGKSTTAFRGVLELSASMVLVAVAIGMIIRVAKHDGVGAVALATVYIGAVVGLMAMASKFSTVKLGLLGNAGGQFKNVLKLAEAMVLIVLAIGMLTRQIRNYGWKDTIIATSYIAGLIVVLSLMSRLSTVKLPDGSSGKGFSGVLGAALAMVAIAIAIEKFTRLIKTSSWKDIGLASLYMLAMLTGMTIISKGLSKLAGIIGKISLISGGIMIGLGLLQELFPGFKDVIANGAESFALIGKGIGGFIGSFAQSLKEAGISIDLGAITQNLDKFSMVIAAVGLASGGISKLATTFAAISAVAAVFQTGFGLLNELFPNFNDTLATGAESLKSVGKGLGGFIGGFLGELSGNATNGLPLIGTNMSEFSKNIKPFMDSFVPAVSEFSLDDVQKFATFTKALATLSPSANSFAGGGLHADSADSSVILGYMEIQRSSYEAYSTAVIGVIGAIQSFMTAMTGFDATQKTNVDNAISSFQSMLSLFTDMTLGTEEETVAGVAGWANSGSTAAILGYANTSNTTVSDMVEAVDTMLSAYTDFVTNDKINSIPADPQSEVQKHLTAIGNLLKAVGSIKMPVKSSVAAGLLAMTGEASAFAGYAAVDHVDVTDIIGKIGELLGKYKEFISDTNVQALNDLDGSEKSQVEKAIGALGGLISAVSAIKMPSQSSVAAGIIAWAGSGRTAAIGGYAKTEEVDVGDMLSKIENLLDKYNEFINSANVEALNNLDGSEKSKVEKATDALSGLIAAVSAIRMPAKSSIATGLMSWAGSGSTFALGGYAKTEEVDVGGILSKIGNLLTQYNKFIKDANVEALNELDGSEQTKVKIAIDHLKSLIAAVSAIRMPAKSSIASGLLSWAGSGSTFALGGFAKTEETDVAELIGQIANLLDSYNKFTTSEDVQKLNGLPDNPQQIVDEYIGKLTKLLQAVANIKLPTEYMKTGGLFGFSSGGALSIFGKTEEKRSSFKEFTDGVSAVMGEFNELVGVVQGVSLADAAMLTVNLKILIAFLKKVSKIDLPVEVIQTNFQDSNQKITTVRTSFASFGTGIKAMFEGFSKLIDTLNKGIKKQSDIEWALGQFKDFIMSLDNYTPPVDWSLDWTKGFTKYENFSDFSDDVSNMGKAIGKFYGGLGETKGAIDAIVALNRSMNEEGKEFSNMDSVAFFSDFISMITSIAAVSKSVAFATDETWFNETALANFFSSMSRMGESIVTLYESGEILRDVDMKNFGNIGEVMINSILDGLQAKDSGDGAYDAIANAIDMFMTPAIATLSQYTSSFVSAGANYAKGMVNGIRSMSSAVKNAAYEVAKAAIDGVTYAWAEHSPSKVAFGLGDYFSLGLANGIENETTTVENAASTLAKGAYADMASTLSSLSSMLDGAIDANPTIRPVMDLSDVSAGFTAIDSMALAQRSIDLAATRSTAAATAQMMLDSNGQNGRIAETVSSISVKLDELTESMQNMQVVMDSGVLAGQLAPSLNRKLGEMTNTARRRSAT